MLDPSRAALLATWRDAVQAAELAERLVTEATEAARNADQHAIETGELVRLARVVAASASRVAERAEIALDLAIEIETRPDAAA
jgi:hypothetical protein